MFGPSIVATSNDDSDSTHSPSSLVNRLEKKVGLATSAQEVKDAVEELWEVLPSSEHSNILAKVGKVWSDRVQYSSFSFCRCNEKFKMCVLCHLLVGVVW